MDFHLIAYDRFCEGMSAVDEILFSNTIENRAAKMAVHIKYIGWAY